MRKLLLVILTLAACTFAQRKALIEPQQLASRPNDNLQSLSIEKLMMTRSVGDTAWSPDARQIAFVTNISGRQNIWLVPAEGGWPTQLTVSEQRQHELAWSPNDRWIAYTSDKDGNEIWDIFTVAPATGEVVNLTKTDSASEESPSWSPDSRYIAYTSRPKTSPAAEIEVFDLLMRRTKHITTTTPPQRTNRNPLWSHDGKSLAWTQTDAAGKDSDIYVADVATGKVQKLTSHTGEHLYFAKQWSPDNKSVLVTSNAANGFNNVALLHLDGKLDWLTDAKWDSEAGSFSPDGRLATWSTNVDGESGITVLDLAKQSKSLLPLAAGVNTLGGAESAFSRDGRSLLYYHNGPTAPNDVWTYSIPDGRSQQITHSLVGALRAQDLVEPDLVQYPSRDGKFRISAWVYAPYNQIRDKKRPAIVYIHGGPASQYENSFNPQIQFLINQGYFVIAPNYRGSTGYGKEFQDANLFDMGGGDLQDVLAAADWISATGFIDPKKLIVMGRSYGGYMTMMATTKSPETWAAGVAIVPFVNWFTEVKNEDPMLQQYDIQTMGDPVKNETLWKDRSPVNFLDRVKAPLLLMAGGNDPRCPKSEAQQVADAIRKNGGTAELKIYENEGHVFGRVESNIDATKRVADFLKFQVPAPGCGCTVEGK